MHPYISCNTLVSTGSFQSRLSGRLHPPLPSLATTGADCASLSPGAPRRRLALPSPRGAQPRAGRPRDAPRPSEPPLRPPLPQRPLQAAAASSPAPRGRSPAPSRRCGPSGLTCRRAPGRRGPGPAPYPGAVRRCRVLKAAWRRRAAGGSRRRGRAAAAPRPPLPPGWPRCPWRGGRGARDGIAQRSAASAAAISPAPPSPPAATRRMRQPRASLTPALKERAWDTRAAEPMSSGGGLGPAPKGHVSRPANGDWQSCRSPRACAEPANGSVGLDRPAGTLSLANGKRPPPPSPEAVPTCSSGPAQRPRCLRPSWACASGCGRAGRAGSAAALASVGPAARGPLPHDQDDAGVCAELGQ